MQLLRPKTPKEAIKLYANHPDATPLAGGTDFMVGWNLGLLDGKTLIDITALKPWSKIRKKGKGWALGSLVTHAELQEHPEIPRRYPLLTEACALVGGEQIQNRGTIGGNIANASPAGDTFPPLAVYNAVVRTASLSGGRRIPFDKIFTGVKKTSLEPAELIEAVELPPLRKPTRSLFRKVGTRAAQAIAKVCAAGLLWLRRDGSVEEIRFALGSVAPTVRRLKEVEHYLKDRKLNQGTLRVACSLIEQDISPIDDIRSTRDYRLEISQNLLRNFLS